MLPAAFPLQTSNTHSNSVIGAADVEGISTKGRCDSVTLTSWQHVSQPLGKLSDILMTYVGLG